MSNKPIKTVSNRFKKQYRQIFKLIKKYNDIVIFRHQLPDFDALGTQLGLAQWLKDNYPKKTIHVVGENHVTFTPRLYPEMDIVEDAYFDRPFLAIVVDTGNTKRISDARYLKAETLVKIDHHPNVEPYGDIVVVDNTLAAASELVANMLLFFKKPISRLAAKYLYTGIVGDSGRFMYSSTSTHTFAIAQTLINTGFVLSTDIYQPMYLKHVDDLKVTAYILNNFTCSKHGVVYYVLPHDIQVSLNITPERGKENINLFASIDGVNAWCSITEDIAKGEWRVSIRSKGIRIDEVAAKFGGGGHAQASGAMIKTIDELPNLINELDKLFK